MTPPDDRVRELLRAAAREQPTATAYMLLTRVFGEPTTDTLHIHKLQADLYRGTAQEVLDDVRADRLAARVRAYQKRGLGEQGAATLAVRGSARARQPHRLEHRGPRREAADVTTPPPFVKVPGNPILYVRAVLQDGSEDWIASDPHLLPQELKRYHPEIPLWRDEKPISASALIRDYVGRLDYLEYDTSIDTSIWRASENGGGILRIACARRPHIEPAESKACAKWLHTIGGALEGKLLDWLATCPDLTWPTAALVLGGPSHAGKGLLAAAVGALWGSAPCSYADVLGTSFNSALRRNPVVFLDEQAPALSAGSGVFRSFVAEVERPLTEKYRPTATLYGAVRLLIATNAEDPLSLGAEQLTSHSEEAIGERVLRIQIPDSAKGLLKREETLEWVRTLNGEPGELVRHLRFLEVTREVTRGDRYLVHGNAAEWARRVGRGDPTAQAVLVACARVAAGDDSATPVDQWAIWCRPGEAWVSAERLARQWRRLTGRDNTPTPETLGRALRRLSPDDKPTKPRDIQRTRVWRIPAEAVIEMADALGIGDPDKVRRSFGTAGPGGGQGGQGGALPGQGVGGPR